MKSSIGYTVSLNIVIVFIVIIFAFIGVSISYYKAFKINNIIADSIEKYEGFNDYSKKEISQKLASLGYNQSAVDCSTHNVNGLDGDNKAKALDGSGHGYCVYYNVVDCLDNGEIEQFGDNTYCQAENYNYIVKTFLWFNVPVVNSWLKFPVYTKTKSLYACYGSNC